MADTRSQPIDIKDIVTQLTDRIEDLCAQVLPKGKRNGHDWVDANVNAGGLGDSMRVCIQGARRGVWKHFSSDQGGDALELISYVMFNGDKGKAVAWAKSYLGLDNADPERIKQVRLKAAASRKKADQDLEKQRESRQKYAKKIWLEGDGILNTPVDMYLAGRGIDLRAFGKVPGALKFSAKLKHANGQFYPAMTAAVYSIKGEFLAVHRTFLQVNSDGSVMKSPELGADAKLVLGGYAGGYIALQRGVSGKPLKDAPAGDEVILSEGIEDGLTIALAKPDARVLACVSVSNFKNQALPENITRVTIAADNDPEVIVQNGESRTHPAHKAVQVAADRFIDEGRAVFVARASTGKDFNDMLRGQA